MDDLHTVDLNGVRVASDQDLVEVYRRRIATLGCSAETLFYANEDHHAAKLAQYATILQRLVKPADSVLDIGCGYGSLAPLLPPCTYLGIDLVPEFIECARKRYPLLHFEAKDLRSLSGRFVWCILLGVINSIPRPHDLLLSAWQKSSEGLIVDFNDATKQQVTLNSFALGQRLEFFLRELAGEVIVYPTGNVWTIFVAKKRSPWLISRRLTRGPSGSIPG